MQFIVTLYTAIYNVGGVSDKKLLLVDYMGQRHLWFGATQSRYLVQGIPVLTSGAVRQMRHGVSEDFVSHGWNHAECVCLRAFCISFFSFWDRILLCSHWLTWNSESSACLCCPPHPTPDSVLQFWDISPGPPCYVYSSYGTWAFLILLIPFLVLGLKGRVATPHWESWFFLSCPGLHPFFSSKILLFCLFLETNLLWLGKHYFAQVGLEPGTFCLRVSSDESYCVSLASNCLLNLLLVFVFNLLLVFVLCVHDVSVAYMEVRRQQWCWFVSSTFA